MSTRPAKWCAWPKAGESFFHFVEKGERKSGFLGQNAPPNTANHESPCFGGEGDIQQGVEREVHRLRGCEHILSISGLHVALVVAAFSFGLARFFAGFSRPLLLRFDLNKVSPSRHIPVVFLPFIAGTGVAPCAQPSWPSPFAGPSPGPGNKDLYDALFLAPS